MSNAFTLEQLQAAFARTLLPGQRSVVHVASVDGGEPVTILDTDALILEAPSWNHVADELILNGDGRLWRLAPDGVGGLRSIDIPGLPPLNNDHIMAPTGNRMYVSANDGHIYEVSLVERTFRRVTDSTADADGNFFMHFLHGVSPDDTTLAFVGLRFPRDAEGRIVMAPSVADLYTVATTGGPVTRLPDGPRNSDGPEYSPDGEWIFYNTESFTTSVGHAQLARMRREGTDIERLTFDDRVNWFPHIAPTGRLATYLSFPPGTEGHPPNLPVEIRVVDVDDWRTPLHRFALFGGQGTMNVNSWSADGSRFAYVSYPLPQGGDVH